MAPPMAPMASPIAAKMPAKSSHVEAVLLVGPLPRFDHVGGITDIGGCRVIDGFVLGRGELLDLFLDEPHCLLVGRPERLPEADGVLDDLHDHRVPVAPLSVIEHPTAANGEVVRVALRERRRDLHLFAGRPRALAVRHVDPAQRRKRRVRAGIIDLHAEVATPLVEIQRPDLEDAALFRVVEPLEVDEVGEQPEQVAVVVHEPIHVTDRLELGCQVEVLLDQCLDLATTRHSRGALRSEPVRASRRPDPSSPPTRRRCL